MKYLMASVALLASAGLVQAGGTFDSAGVIKGKTSATFHPISDGHMVMEFTNTQTSFEMADPANPLAGMTGRCTGAMEIRGPAVSGGGVCIAQSDGGDMAFVRWQGQNLSADGALNGSWVMIGGTGSMAGISGGGQYSSLTDRSTGDYVNTLTGAVALP